MSQEDIQWNLGRAPTQLGVGPTGVSESNVLRTRTRDHGGYLLGAPLGQSGRVFEAQNARFAGRLIVKLFPFAGGLPSTVIDAYVREASAVAALRHPHVAQVFDSGTLADGTPFVVMERLLGQTLEERLLGREALPVSELLPVVRGIASALSAAHGVRVVHGELRPENIFIADLTGYELGFAKVLDFGVWYLTTAARSVGRIIAPHTFRTRAPEQKQVPVGHIDERTDQFALAALSYRLLTGVEPTFGPETAQGFARVNQGQNRPSAFFLQSAPAVETVLNQALAIRPEHRFDSVALFFRALEEALVGTSLIATPGPIRRGVAEMTVVPATSPEDLAPAEVAMARAEAPTPLAHAAVTGVSMPERSEPPSYAAPPAQHAPHASLTQQFFVDGERQEASHWVNSPLARETEAREAREARDDRGATFVSFDRIPRRRKPLLVAVLAVIGGLTVAAWSMGWWAPVTWRMSSTWRILHLPGAELLPGEWGAAKTEAGGPSNEAAAPPDQAATPGQAAPPNAVSAPPKPAAAPATRTTAPTQAAPPNQVATPTKAAVAPSNQFAVPSVDRAVPARGHAIPPAALANTPSSPIAVPRIPAVVQSSNGSAHRKEKFHRQQAGGPLRGYVWSSGQHQLVPAHPAAPPIESLPAPSEPVSP